MDLEEKIKEFCIITGVNEEIANDALNNSNGNLDLAVQMFIDGAKEDQLLRKPMPQKYDKLVDDNPLNRNLYRQQQNNIAVNPFNGIRGDPQASTSRKRPFDILFNPPTDITCKMPFEMAKKCALNNKSFLLVDIQNSSEFECCVLNRDIWSDLHIRELIRLHFILWQVRADSEDGKKFIQFYKVHLWPYIAIIDPRTGENLCTLNTCKLDAVIQTFESFLEEHHSFHQALDCPQSKRRKIDKLSIIDLSEDDQLTSVIQESLKSNRSNNGNSDKTSNKCNNDSDNVSHVEDSDDDNDDTSTDADDDLFSANYVITSNKIQPQNIRLLNSLTSKSESISSIMQNHTLTDLTTNIMTNATNFDSICRVIIRLRDGSRHNLNRPSSTKLNVLFDFVDNIVPSPHQLLLMWPKKKLTLEDDGEKSFADVGLYPNNIVYVEDGDDDS